LAEHALIEDQLFERDRDKDIVMARETKWKVSKFNEVALIYMKGGQVVSAPIMDIDLIWRSRLDEYNKTVKPLKVYIAGVSLRRSARLKEKQGTEGAPPAQQERRQALRSFSRRGPKAPSKI
jgi:hypothetical protein